jgi:hypothetical protein
MNKSISVRKSPIIIVILAVTINCYGGSFFISEQKMLGCYQVESLCSYADSLAISKLDSIKTADTKEKPNSYPNYQVPHNDSSLSMYPNKFNKFPIIDGKWHFTLDSCLIMYSVYTGFTLYDAPRDVFESALYNQCNLSIYHFGGDINAFSRVVEDYLRNNYQSPHIIELLRLYINTFTDESRVYILQSSDYVDSLFNLHIYEFLGESKDDYAKKRRKDLENDRENVKKLIKNVNVNTFPGSMTLEFYTWNYSSGNLEKWKFRATKESLELIERSNIAKNIGPHIPLGLD